MLYGPNLRSSSTSGPRWFSGFQPPPGKIRWNSATFYPSWPEGLVTELSRQKILRDGALGTCRAWPEALSAVGPGPAEKKKSKKFAGFYSIPTTITPGERCGVGR